MVVFKKTCFSCGKKTNELFEGKCEECFTDQLPPIKEIKQLNVKFCNSCGKIHYNNSLYEVSEFEGLLPTFVKPRVILNDGYKLKSVSISDFEVIGNKLNFDVNVETDLS